MAGSVGELPGHCDHTRDKRPIRGQYPCHVITLDQSEAPQLSISLSSFLGNTFNSFYFEDLKILNNLDTTAASCIVYLCY